MVGGKTHRRDRALNTHAAAAPATLHVDIQKNPFLSAPIANLVQRD